MFGLGDAIKALAADAARAAADAVPSAENALYGDELDEEPPR
jgi:hypothetical protein